MNVELTSAFFLPRPRGENSGVDFLGLRQANLDMMAELIPAVNNVTIYIRPFSLLCWIYWKFHALCVEADIVEPTSHDLQVFRERIEVLFTWGARLVDYQGIPGKQAEPPASGDDPVPLTFNDWGRVQSSTSLVAALWYGPASKTLTGLGFLMPVPGKTGFFKTVEHGVVLAEALDQLLRADAQRYGRLLATLSPVTATIDDARALWKLWNPGMLSPREKEAFEAVLFNEGTVGDYSTTMGRRSSTLALARLHMKRAAVPLSVPDVRCGMFLSQSHNGVPYDVPEELQTARRQWIILQMRQLQRLALESLLSWCEMQIIAGREDTAALVQMFESAWQDTDFGFDVDASLSELLSQLDERFSSLDLFIASCKSGHVPTPFTLIDEIREERRAGSEKLAPLCFYAMLLCAAFAGCKDSDDKGLRVGGAARLSLLHLRRRLVALGNADISEAVRYVIEAMVISQHFATAVNRFDGQNQRLRLAIGDMGLESLVGEPWRPAVTEDRLPTLLSLAAESGIIQGTSDHPHYSSS
jgi:hypothetical protein